MLHLQPRIHLHEVDRPGIEVVDELDRAGADVFHLVGERRRVFAHGPLKILGQHGGTRLFDHLLLVALHAAIAQAEHPGVAVVVAQHLRLDVTQRSDVFLKVDIAVAEGGAGLRGNALKQLVEAIPRFDHLDPLAAAAVHGLDQYRVTDLVGQRGRPVDFRHDAVTTRNHRHAEAHRRRDGVRLVPHDVHRDRGRTDEVDPARAHDLGELAALGKESDAGMQGVDALVLRYGNDGKRVEVALVGRGTTDAHHRVLRRQHVHRHRFHVRVGLDQHDPDPAALGDTDEFDGGAATRVYQHLGDRPDQVLRPDRRPGRRGHGPLLAEHPRHHAIDHVRRGLHGNRDVRIDLAQFVIEVGQHRVFDEALHRPGRVAEVVGENGVHGQVRRHDDLAGERHAGAREVVGLRQRMRHEAGLGAAGAVAKAEHDDGQVVVAHETRHAVVDGRHREERAGALLRLHATGRDETDHRQVLFGACDQQLAELLRAGHIEGAGLEVRVRDDGAGAQTAIAILERADAGYDAAGRRVAGQRGLDGLTQARKFTGVGTQEIGEQFLEVGKKHVDERLRRRGPPRLEVRQRVLDAQVAVGDVESIPEVLATDFPGRDPAVVAAAVPLRAQVGQQQSLEQEGDDHQKRIRQVRESPLFPLFHGAKEVPGTGIVRDAPVPVEELPLEAQGNLFRGLVRRRATSRTLGGRRESQVNQAGERRLRQAARAAGFFGDGIETCDGVIVDGIEQQEVLALRSEVLTQIVFQQYVEHRALRLVCFSASLRLVCRGHDERRKAILEDHPVHDQVRGGLAALRHRLARALCQFRRDDQVVHRPFGHGEVQLRRQLRADVGVGFAVEMLRREQFAALVGKALAQQRSERGVAGYRTEQGPRFANLVHANQGADLGMVRQVVFQGGEVARGIGLPPIEEIHARVGEQGRAGFPVVLCRLAQDQPGETAPLIAERFFARDVVFPCPRKHIVVADLVGILHPFQEHPSAFARRPRRQFALRQPLLRQAPVLLLGGGLDAPAAAEIAKVAVGDAEDIRILGGVARHTESPALLDAPQSFGRGEIAFQAAPIVIEDIGVVGDERRCCGLDGLNAGDDGEAQVLERVRLARTVVDDAVDVALVIQLERRQSDLLGALLPGQVEPARDAGETLRLDRAEDAVAYRQQEVARRQGNGPARVTEAEDDADVRHLHASHLGNQPGDAVRLVVAIRLRLGVRAGRIHESDDGHGAIGGLRHPVGRGDVVFGSPDTVVDRTVLGYERDRALHAVEIHAHGAGVEGPVAQFVTEPLPEAPYDIRGRRAPRVLRVGDDGFDVRIDVHVRQHIASARYFRLLQQTPHGPALTSLETGKQREVLGQTLGDKIQPIIDRRGFIQARSHMHWEGGYCNVNALESANIRLVTKWAAKRQVNPCKSRC